MPVLPVQDRVVEEPLAKILNLDKSLLWLIKIFCVFN